jgi:hypothetical protein
MGNDGSVTAPPVLLVEALGRVYELSPQTPAARDTLAREWSRCLVDSTDGREPIGIDVPEGPTEQATGYALASRLTALGILQLRGTHVMFHAAALASGDGSVLALVAASGRGKTTAALRLAQAGLGYVTDETVAIDAAGSVLPYEKPLSVVDGDMAPGPKVQHSPDDLGMGQAPSRLRLARLALINRVPDVRGEPRLKRLLLMDGLLALIPQSSSLGRLELPLQTLCRLIDECGGVFELTYSEITDAVSPLKKFLSEGRDGGGADWEPLVRRPPSTYDMTWALQDGRIRRRPCQDAVEIDGEALLMIDDKPMRLSGLGVTIWKACEVGISIEQLTSAVVAAHGDHPDAVGLVRRALSALCEEGALAWGKPLALADLLGGRR